MQRIWLVRHGVTRWNEQLRFCGHSDIPLSPSGYSQAEWLASQLQTIPLKRIYTSDLLRARETAEIIANKHSYPVEVNVLSAWREVAFGAWEGLTYAEIASTFKGQLDFFTDPEQYAPPDGESLKDVLKRAQSAFMEIIRNFSTLEGDIAIVSHGGTLRGLLCTLLGMSLKSQWQLRLDPGSLNAIDVSLDEQGLPLTTLALLNFQPSTINSACTDSERKVQQFLVQPETEPFDHV